MTLLLTGGTGYLGSRLASALCHEHSVHILKRSTSSLQRLETALDRLTFHNLDEVQITGLFQTISFDAIIHCATDYGRKTSDPVEILEANLVLPLTLLTLGRKHGIPIFVNTDTILDKRVSGYALSKSQFRDWFRAFSTNMVCVNVELEHFYGPHDDKTKFVPHLLEELNAKKPSISLTPGEQRRYFVYIDDVIQAFVLILGQLALLKRGFHNYQVADLESTTIRELCLLAKKLLGNTETTLEFGAMKYRENEIMEPEIDLGPLLELGWRPSVSLESGLTKTIFEQFRSAADRKNRDVM